MGFSLYIHIPWCHAKCPYCDFNSYAASVWPEDRYVDAIVAELTYRAAQAPWRGNSIATIFFGGGTPSLFAPQSIARILDAASRWWKIERDAEITLEANPGTVNGEKLAGMRAAGVNRISFGAQSFNPAILKFLGRIHSAEDTREAARMAHRAGFDRLNLDLIFAVPGQTTDDIRADIDAAVALGPDHISAYNLTFEEGTPFFSDLKRGRIRQLPSDDQAAMYAMVRMELPRRGYAMYEISNYAAPGHEARHNLTYWRGESYLGIGAGAHSFGRIGAAGRRWWNERSPGRYMDRTLHAGLAEAGSEVTGELTAAGEFVFLNLRLLDGFALADFSRRFDRGFNEIFGAQAIKLVADGLLINQDGRVRLSDRGLELADSVFAEFV
ncbi:MAG: radical SAM family heme chaperone HemW [Candidatus Binataceae bacterium]|nr:radical SAM family heme chaperone HemW [Candidatus Binataceae bacterium]